MCNHGQQQYFSDVIKLSIQRENIFYFFVNDYHVDQESKLDEFKSYHFILQAEYLDLKGIDLALHTEIHCRSPHIKNRCFIGHGFHGKATVWHQENLKSFNHYFLYGPKDRKIFDFVSKNDQTLKKNITFWEVGYPKYDFQFSASSMEIKDIAREIGLNPSKKTILFAPAWDPRGILRTHGLKIFNLFRALDEYNFIIKLHPASLAGKKSKHYDFYTGGIDWRKEISKQIREDRKQKERNRSNLFFPNLSSINPLFKISDLLFTDFSGVMQGFYIEKKPVIAIKSPEFYNLTLCEWGSDGMHSFDNPLFNNGIHAAHLISDIFELKEMILCVLSNPNAKSKEREKVVKDLLYNPGNGTKIFLKTLTNILDDASKFNT